ncbi:MAG: hypothetical protein WCI31_14090 [Prolixibacteraceae bacterium]
MLQRIFLIIVLLGISCSSFAQLPDSTKAFKYFSGSVLVTNKGISTIPNFTLGKPATILNFTLGRKIRFEPELRFALEGKPWMFIFWLRTELFKSEKFAIRLGANPTIGFKTLPVTFNGVQNDRLLTYRTLTADLTPTYSITKTIGIGLYYMYVYGIEDITTKNTHYLAARAYFTRIRLSGDYFAKFTPQFYYLNQDGVTGTYLSTTLSLNKKNFPFSIATMINRPIHTDIAIGNKLIWNLSVIYAFNHTYVKK